MIAGIISDIHEDVERLKKVLRVLENHHCDKLICLGDITGYEPKFYRYRRTRDANACIDLLHKNFDLVVAGNHDLYALRKIPDHRFGFDYPENWYELDYDKRKELGNHKLWLYEQDELPINLSTSSRNYLLSLNETAQIESDGLKIHFSHYLFPDLNGSSTQMPPDRQLANSHLDHIDHQGCHLSFFGHMHPEGIWHINHKTNGLQKWGMLPLGEKMNAYGVPAICKGTNRKGFVILNTSEGYVKSIKL